MARLTQQELQAAIDTLMVINANGDITADLFNILLSDQMESVEGLAAVDIEVSEVSDLNAYINGDKWTFNKDVNIIIKDNLVFDKAFDNNGFTIHILKKGFAGGLLTYTGTGALLRGSGPLIACTNLNVILTGTGSSFFDTDGADVLLLEGAQVIFVGSNQSIGSIKNTNRAVNFKLSTFIGYQDGVDIDCTRSVSLADVGFLSNGLGTSTSLRVNKEALVINLNLITFTLGAGEKCLYIDPDLQGSLDMTSCTNFNDFEFYEPGVQGTFSAIADMSIGSTGITSVTDNSGQAQFNHAGSNVFVGQEVVVSGFITNTAYNGTYRVRATAAGSFELGLPFGTTETGAFLSNSITVTANAHGLSELDTFLFEDGPDYYGGATIYNVQTNSFQINRTFVGTKSGTWDTGSITEDDSRINGKDIGNEADSASYGSIHFNNNAADTSITNGAYGDIAFTGIIEVDVENSRFFVNNTANGELTYRGRKPFRGSYKVIIASPISVSIEDYRLSYQINDSVPVFATAPFMPWNLRQAGDQCIIEYKVILQPGDRIRPKLAGDGGAIDIKVAHGIIDIS